METDCEGSGLPALHLEEAVTDLQMRVTYQEDEIRHLNRIVEHQRSDLDALNREIERLKGLVTALAPARAEPVADERPPHY